MPSTLKHTLRISILTVLMADAAAQVPLVELPRVEVVGELLTGSAATVSVVELDGQPTAATNVAAVAGQAANFFVATNGARSFNDVFALRGLTNTPIFGDPAVSVYLDDLPLGNGFTYPVELSGFDRVELHRGPTQNTVFGRAGSAGVLTFATPEPGASPQGELRAALGSFGARTVRATASSAGRGPLEAFVNANYSARDGYITNTTLQRDLDFQDSRSGLVRLRARPGAESEITLLTTYSRSRDGSQPLVPLGGPLFAVSRSREGFTNLEAWNAALTAACAIPAGRLSATLSRSDWELDPYRSVLAFGPGSELGNEVRLRQRTWNGELKLTGAAPSAIHWSAGLFYSDGRTDGAFARAFGPFLFEQSGYRIFASSLAGLGEATWPVGDRLTVTAGLRLEDSRKRMHRIETVPAPRTYENEVTASAWLPKRGCIPPGEGKTFFATVGAGFKPGGFSAFTGNASLAAFGPERTKTAEAGVTLQRPGNALAATAGCFSTISPASRLSVPSPRVRRRTITWW
jgi:iron complex outermembrane receptor protein